MNQDSYCHPSAYFRRRLSELGLSASEQTHSAMWDLVVTRCNLSQIVPPEITTDNLAAMVIAILGAR
jgi:hypothetical protein